MENLRGIGQLARESGLTVSALRFYDGAGVLEPAHVDARTGYRSYAPDQVVVARLVASLRRVGMPLAGIRAVLACRADADAVEALLAGHVRLLERGLADARRELSTVRSMLCPEDNPMTPTAVTVRGTELAAALRAVRFAVGTDAELPALTGVLMEIEQAAVTLVATDRYRLAVSSAPVLTFDGPPVRALVPAGAADRLPGAGTVAITVDGETITVRAGSEVQHAALLPDAFPDHRRLRPAGGQPVPVDTALRAELATGPTRVMQREPDGAEFEMTILRGMGVNREFLLEALDAGGEGQLELDLDGPLAPLVIRGPRSVSLLMPVRLE